MFPWQVIPTPSIWQNISTLKLCKSVNPLFQLILQEMNVNWWGYGDGGRKYYKIDDNRIFCFHGYCHRERNCARCFYASKDKSDIEKIDRMLKRILKDVKCEV